MLFRRYNLLACTTRIPFLFLMSLYIILFSLQSIPTTRSFMYSVNSIELQITLFLLGTYRYAHICGCHFPIAYMYLCTNNKTWPCRTVKDKHNPFDCLLCVRSFFDDFIYCYYFYALFLPNRSLFLTFTQFLFQ